MLKFSLVVLSIVSSLSVAAAGDRPEAYFSIVTCKADVDTSDTLNPARFDVMGIIGFPKEITESLIVGAIKYKGEELAMAGHYFVQLTKEQNGKFTVSLNYQQNPKNGHIGKIHDLSATEPALVKTKFGAEQLPYSCKPTIGFADYAKFIYGSDEASEEE